MEAKKDNRRGFGKTGEELAADFLANNGYRIIERNYRAGKMGEIDIIAQENEYICFIEVKTRTGNLFGKPCEAVTTKKQSSLRKLAWTWLKLHGMSDKPVRFDIVEVIGRKKEGSFVKDNINIIRNAF